MGSFENDRTVELFKPASCISIQGGRCLEHSIALLRFLILIINKANSEQPS